MRLLLFASIALVAAVPASGYQRDDRADHYAQQYKISRAEAERRLELMNEIHRELPRLQEQLDRHERGNYANLWMEHEPMFRVVVAFKRDAEATLRRYTSNPNIVARQVRYSMEELEAARTDATEQLVKLGVPLGMTDADEVGNDVDIVLRLEQPEVERLLASGKLKLHPAVKVTGPAPLPRPAVTPEAARLIRIFPQDPHRSLGGTRELGYGTIILKDGCLRFDGPGEADPVIYFAAETGLKREPEGKLAFYNRGNGEILARVGERLELTAGAGRGRITVPDILAPIRQACGTDEVTYGGFFKSERR